MKYLFVRVVIITLVCTSCFVDVRSQNIGNPLSSEAARELWELAIVAKGGREVINRVDSIALIYDYSESVSVRLAVFPNKSFYWFGDKDLQAKRFVCKIRNYESGFGFSRVGFIELKTYQDIRTHSDFSSSTKGDLLVEAQLLYLLETRWQKPEIIEASKFLLKGVTVDRINVSVPGDTADRRAIFLDEKTHLPIRIEICRGKSGELLGWGTEFKAYKIMQGIAMPTKTSMIKQSKWDSLSIEINPDYNAKIFDEVPDFLGAAFQWRNNRNTQKPESLSDGNEKVSSQKLQQWVSELSASNSDTSQEAYRELVSVGSQAIPILSAALNSKVDPLLRYRVASILTTLDKTNSLVEVFIECLLDSRLGPSERQDAAFGLLKDEKGISALTDLLTHQDVFVRRYVIFAFDALTERSSIPEQVSKAVPILKKLTKDADTITSKMAQEVLDQIGNRFKR